jgi:hypothetical protein
MFKLISETLKRWANILSDGECTHPMEASVDMSGDGSQIEWECVMCGRTKLRKYDG